MRTQAPNGSFGWFRGSFYPCRLPASLTRLTSIPTSAARLGKSCVGLYLIRLTNRGK